MSMCVNCDNTFIGQQSFIRHGEPLCNDCMHNILGILGNSSYGICALVAFVGSYIRFNGRMGQIVAGDDGFLYFDSHSRILSIESLVIDGLGVSATGI